MQGESQKRIAIRESALDSKQRRRDRSSSGATGLKVLALRMPVEACEGEHGM